MNKELKLPKNWLSPIKRCFYKNNIKYFFVFYVVFNSLSFISQTANYINNGSMEDKYDCNIPNYGRKAKYWRGVDSVNDIIDYNSVCYGNIPINGYTYQFPKIGNSYFLSTLLCVPPACAATSNRVYFRNRLKTNLVNGKIYCVKFYVNISDNSSYGIDAIGAYFGDNSLDTITYGTIPLTYLTPQVQNTPGNIITDTMNWVPITGTFVANGTEKHCVIGNFKSDVATTKTLINTINAPNVYCNILLDDVSCIPIDLPAYAGADAWAIPGTTIYIGRPQDVGIDEACKWYNLTNTTTPIANAAGFSLTVSATTTTYIVKQDICGVIKYDTVVVHPSALGLNELKIKNDNLIISPNPTSDKLNIQFTINDLDKEFTKAEIINNIGELIKVIDLNYTDNTATISTNELPAGVYHLLIKSQTQSINRRFVIAR